MQLVEQRELSEHLDEEPLQVFSEAHSEHRPRLDDHIHSDHELVTEWWYGDSTLPTYFLRAEHSRYEPNDELHLRHGQRIFRNTTGDRRDSGVDKDMRWAKFVLPALIPLLIALPPLTLGTRTYPVAVVDGNSMTPTLAVGDLFLFRSIPPSSIRNGTVIVYFSGQTGNPILDYFIRPIVVHRVVGVVIQSDGVVYYRTRGDNNHFNDPALVRSESVLGSPVLVVPLVGEALLFLKSPYGLVFFVSVFVLSYLNRYDERVTVEKRKKKLLAVFARMFLNGEIGRERFEKLRLAVEFEDVLPSSALGDPELVALSDWSERGGFANDWEEDVTMCPRCLRPALQISSGRGPCFIMCETCNHQGTVRG